LPRSPQPLSPCYPHLHRRLAQTRRVNTKFVGRVNTKFLGRVNTKFVGRAHRVRRLACDGPLVFRPSSHVSYAEEKGEKEEQEQEQEQEEEVVVVEVEVEVEGQ
jgi:hypothetical protein